MVIFRTAALFFDCLVSFRGIMLIFISLIGSMYSSSLADIETNNTTYDSISGSSLNLMIQTGHAEAIRSIAMSPDGRYMATASQDKSARLWDMSMGVTVRTFKKHTGNINAVAFSHDGKYLATGSEDGSAVIWNVLTGQEVITVQKDPVYDLAFTRDDRILVTAGSTVDFWEISSGTNMKTYAAEQLPSSSPQSMALSPDGNALIFVNAFSGNILNIQFGVSYPFMGGAESVHFSPDGKYFATGHRGSAKLWDFSMKKAIRSFKGDGKVKFSPDGKYLLHGNRLYDMRSYKLARVFQYKGNSGFISVEFTTNGRHLAEGRGDGSAYLWNTHTGQITRSWEGQAVNVWSVAFSPDGNSLVTGGGAFHVNKGAEGAGRVTLWDLRKGSIEQLKQDNEPVFHVAFHQAGGSVIAADSTFINIWDMKTSKNRSFHPDIGETVSSAAISPNGQIMALGSGPSGKVTIVNVRDGSVLREFKEPYFFVYSISFSSDGRYVAAGDAEGHVWIWNVNNGSLERSFKGKLALTSVKESFGIRYCSVVFSPDGKYLFMGCSDNGMGKLLDSRTWKEVRSFDNPDIWNAAFSPDGEYLATAGADRTVRLWSISSGKEVSILLGHKSDVWTVAFSPDGKYIASGSFDGTAKLWDREHRRETATFVALDKDKYAITTPDGYYKSARNGIKEIYFVKGNQAYMFDNFDLLYNRPDIIIERLGRADHCLVESYRSAYQKRVKKMGFAAAAMKHDLQIPKVDIMNAQLPLETDKRSFTLTVRATDPRHYIDRLNIYVNDVPIYGRNGLSVSKLRSREVKKDISFELSLGSNRIRLSALNNNGAESLSKMFVVTYNGRGGKPDLYIAAVGVSDYQNNSFNLKYASKDAADILKVYGNRHDIFGEIKTLAVLDKNVTRTNVRQLRDFFKQTKTDDVAVLFIAGHGVLDDNLNYYFATTNFNLNAPEENGILFDEIEDILDGISSRNKILLLDTCHSGELDADEAAAGAGSFGKGVRVINTFNNVRALRMSSYMAENRSCKGSFRLRQELFTHLVRGSGAMIISSASGAELAFESDEWNNGVFTYAFLEGIRSGRADLNYDGQITVSEARDYVVKKVSTLTNGRQTPTSRQENLENDFRIY